MPQEPEPYFSFPENKQPGWREDPPSKEGIVSNLPVIAVVSLGAPFEQYERILWIGCALASRIANVPTERTVERANEICDEFRKRFNPAPKS